MQSPGYSHCSSLQTTTPLSRKSFKSWPLCQPHHLSIAGMKYSLHPVEGWSLKWLQGQGFLHPCKVVAWKDYACSNLQIVTVHSIFSLRWGPTEQAHCIVAVGPLRWCLIVVSCLQPGCWDFLHWKYADPLKKVFLVVSQLSALVSVHFAPPVYWISNNFHFQLNLLHVVPSSHEFMAIVKGTPCQK